MEVSGSGPPREWCPRRRSRGVARGSDVSGLKLLCGLIKWLCASFKSLASSRRICEFKELARRLASGPAGGQALPPPPNQSAAPVGRPCGQHGSRFRARASGSPY